MLSPSWENLDEFLQPESAGGFAILAVITLHGDGERHVWGIFDDPYLNADLGEYDVDTSAPRFTCKERDVVGVGRGDYWQRVNPETLQPVGERFNIMTYPQSDGAGVAILKMEPL